MEVAVGQTIEHCVAFEVAITAKNVPLSALCRVEVADQQLAAIAGFAGALFKLGAAGFGAALGLA